MNTDQLRRVLIRVATIAPHLTGGAAPLQRERMNTLLDHFGATPTDADAHEALRNLTRNGTGGDRLTWSTIVAETLNITRRRLDTPPTLALRDEHGTAVPHTPTRKSPANLAALVAEHRDRVRHDATTRPCPECHAPPHQPCQPIPDREHRDPRAGIHPDHGMHHQRLHHGHPTVTPHDRRSP